MMRTTLLNTYSERSDRKLMNLRARRKMLGISQIELASKVGVSLMAYQLWERGVSEPKEENKEKLERVLSQLEKEFDLKIQAMKANREG